MARSLEEALSKIEMQRNIIHDYIMKYEMNDNEREDALKRIKRAQAWIKRYKNSCEQYIKDSWEDTWSD